MDFKGFKNPDPIYRPAPFWSWNDKLDKDELKRQIKEMTEKGWGGFFMHSRVGLVTGYLSDEWMEMIRFCAEEAKSTNTYAWLYDEDKWPSGFAGGEVSQNMEYRSRALVLLKDNELTEDDTLMQSFKFDNTEYSICKRISPLGNLWFNGASYVDLMNPEAVKEFIKCTHERYKSSCGEYFGKGIEGIFTDEPCYLMEKLYEVPVLPWSEYLPDFFFNLKGYQIADFLPELFFNVNDYRKIRFDFFDAATRLFIESFTKQYSKWCNNNSLKMAGHFMAEDALEYQTRWIGAAMPHYEFMDWPGIDKLGRTIEQVATVKQLTSVADQLGKERSLSELFCGIGQQTSFFHRKWLVDWQVALGISFVNYHLSLYSMRGERKRDYPPNLFYQQPWWDNEKEFSDYIARLSFSVTQGVRELEILIIHPVASAWSEFSPLTKDNSKPFVYDSNDFLNNLSKLLTANKLDYHYGDEIIMEKHARVENGRLVIGQHSYSTVIIPQCITLRSETVSLLNQFSEQAGASQLIMIKPYTERIDGNLTEICWPEKTVALNCANEVLAILNEYYPDRLRVIDEITGNNASKIICHTRVSENEKYVFLANTDDKREIKAVISVPGEFVPYIFDLRSGSVFSLPYRIEEGRIEIKAKFYPSGSMLLHLSIKKVHSVPAPEYLDTGIAINLDSHILTTADQWSVKILDKNVMPLNNVTLYLEGMLKLKNQPVAKALHDYFYKSVDDTPFKAEYAFNVLNVPQGEVFAVVEVAENLDRIVFNGIEISSLKSRGEMGAYDENKSWMDINFTKVPLTGLLSAGTNNLVLEGRKINNITGPATHIGVKDFKNHRPTEVEAVYIVGDFIVADEDKTEFYIDKSLSVYAPYNLTETGFPFYAGKIAYSTTASICKNGTDKLYLKVNEVKAACIELFVNGIKAGLKYWEPYVYDITDLVSNGENDIQIVATATLFNLMGPNRITGINEEVFVRASTYVDAERYTEKYTLLPFGIKSISLMEHETK